MQFGDLPVVCVSYVRLSRYDIQNWSLDLLLLLNSAGSRPSEAPPRCLAPKRLQAAVNLIFLLGTGTGMLVSDETARRPWGAYLFLRMDLIPIGQPSNQLSQLCTVIKLVQASIWYWDKIRINVPRRRSTLAPCWTEAGVSANLGSQWERRVD